MQRISALIELRNSFLHAIPFPSTVYHHQLRHVEQFRNGRPPAPDVPRDDGNRLHTRLSAGKLEELRL